MSSIQPVAGINLSLLVGTLSRAPELRSLPSGSEVLHLELTVRVDGASAESVPVTCPDPSGPLRALVAGDEVAVVGRVRRRFFRAGGATQSRTEVVAKQVVPTRRTAAAAKVLSRAVDTLVRSG